MSVFCNNQQECFVPVFDTPSGYGEPIWRNEDVRHTKEEALNLWRRWYPEYSPQILRLFVRGGLIQYEVIS